MMNIAQTKTALVSGLAGVILATSFQAFAQHSSTGHPMKKSSQMTMMDTGAKELHKVMMDSAQKMMAEKKPMAAHTDKAFALLMAEHHESAVKMADIELREGKNPALRSMAKKMKSAQLMEIKQLRKIAATLK